ncbi:stigma-specific STIG1-like protein 1 [Herrania umbratica]|uniref:Stigma-specific STIG1-like protein 1 n=1 Tax=Herrania umbratica TaxID=108875 RepID=A0A6J1B3Z1_9ROSI|nr:stigma-specific STIG1-like protein 1 [Herrania umbratica]
MKSLKLFFMLAMVMALGAITLSACTPPSKEEPFLHNGDDKNATETSDREPTSIRGAGRFLAQSSSRAILTCDKNPKVCLTEGSQGPSCCRKKCVDLKTDKFNCGKCGKKCNYSKICCKGKCVNPLSNQKHCGGCNNSCGNGNACLYGMCSYA